MDTIKSLNIDETLNADKGTPFSNVLEYEQIHSLMFSDKLGIVSFYWSNDGTNSDYFETFSLTPNVGMFQILTVKAKYLSIAYTFPTLAYPIYFRCGHLFI